VQLPARRGGPALYNPGPLPSANGPVPRVCKADRPDLKKLLRLDSGKLGPMKPSNSAVQGATFR
jgi:hypothetical protein